MKRLFLIGIMILSVVCSFSQDIASVKTLKEQQKVLELTAKLNKLQIELEKKNLEHNALISKAASVDADANTATMGFITSDPSSTVKEAKGIIKKLEETKDINKKLAKNQKDLSKIEKNIDKLKTKINKLNKEIQFIDK